MKGDLVRYRFESPPDLGKISETGDPGTALVNLVSAKRSKGKSPATPVAGDVPAGEVWTLTLADAEAYVQPSLAALAQAVDGEINTRLNSAAFALGHFGSDFWSKSVAVSRLRAALASTVYDGATWNAEEVISHGLKDGAADRQAVLGQPAPYEDRLEGILTPTSLRQPAQESTPGMSDRLTIRARLDARVYDSNDLAAIPQPIPLMVSVLFVSTVVMLLGKFGTYKTFLAVAWAAHIATGTPWAGHDVPIARPVLYVAAEGSSGISRRLAAWRKRHGPIPRGMFTVIAIPTRLTDVETVEWLTEQIRKHDAGFVVLDTLHRCAPGVEENSAKDMGAVIDTVLRVQADTGATVLIVHHTGHGGVRARGSSVNEDDIDTSFVILLGDKDGENRDPSIARVLKHRKSKEGELLEELELTLDLVEETGSGVLEVQAHDAPPDEAPVSAEDIALLDGLDPPPTGVHDARKQLHWKTERAAAAMRAWRTLRAEQTATEP